MPKRVLAIALYAQRSLGFLHFSETSSWGRNSGRLSSIRIASPLVEEGVLASEDRRKPLLLYCPGIDGSRLSIFLQLPKLGDKFDVRCLEFSDRPSVDDIMSAALQFVGSEGRPYYVLGESFGAIVALRLNDAIAARGIVLVNPATTFRGSRLQQEQENGNLFFSSDLGPFVCQLLAIFSGFFLPKTIDTPEREAYMGRFALSLPTRIGLLPSPETIQWRIANWLDEAAPSPPPEKTLVVLGERDEALPQLSMWDNYTTVVVPGAAHGTTLGVRCDLASLLTTHFLEEEEPHHEAGDDFLGLVRRSTHPRVDPRTYDGYRVNKSVTVCNGDDCRKDGSTDVRRLLTQKFGPCSPTSCLGLCGDGPVVTVTRGESTTQTFLNVRDVAKVDDIVRSLGVLDPPVVPESDIVSRRQGPLDLHRNNRILLQRAAWFAILCAVNLVEQEGHVLTLFPDRLLVATAFLATLTIVPESNRDLAANLRAFFRSPAPR